ncbi:DUF4831 family protein [Duncaniella muricolitica]|uniref:DUF4831 family protein n=1 Tax=Duncaniella muricolitica TaxID=2880704 RepID=UPI00244E1F18|nr:DUF4831 family protein [Duncaniella muricolitica]
MKSQIIALMLGACAVAGTSAQTTSKLTASKANEYGLIYTLPLTSFEVTIAAEKTVRTPGEFYQYAKKYLNTDPILAPSVSWRITDAVIEQTAYPDVNERYLVTLKGGNGVFITVNDSNYPIAVNDDSSDGSIEPIDRPQAVEAQPTILERPVARQAVTPEMIQSKSSAKRAELAAAKIYELRTNRNEIISGQADAMPSDGAAMKLALEQIAAQEEALTAMFIGTVQTSVEVRTYRFEVPVDGAPERTVVARLSAVDGLVSADDLSGAPIYVTVTPQTRGELPLNEKGIAKTFPKGGVAYRIPGTARVDVTYDGETLADGTYEVAQYGVVFGLDPALFTSKKSPAYLRFNPLTGSIRELGTISE